MPLTTIDAGWEKRHDGTLAPITDATSEQVGLPEQPIFHGAKSAYYSWLKDHDTLDVPNAREEKIGLPEQPIFHGAKSAYYGWLKDHDTLDVPNAREEKIGLPEQPLFHGLKSYLSGWMKKHAIGVYRVYGKVYDALTGQPLPDAEIEIEEVE